jgi:predicted dienelactone hydrolase
MLHPNNRRSLLFGILTFALTLLAPSPQGAAMAGSATGFLSRSDDADRFAVGHSIQVLNIPGTLGEPRPVDVHLWYPADGDDDCHESDGSRRDHDDQNCRRTPSVYTSRLNGVPLLPQWAPLSWTIGSRTSFENLPVARGHRRFPVIVFSHGSGNNAIDYVYTLETLARRGFIVAAPDHVNNTQDDVWIDFVNAEAPSQVLPCFDGLAPPCARSDVPTSMIDRARDISAVVDALPIWFGDRADQLRVGVMGHSRGTVTALVAAGGSATWGLSADPRVKAIVGLAIGAQDITFAANVQDVTVPTLLVAGRLDKTLPVSQAAFDALGSTDKELMVLEQVNHRHFDSGLCAQTQSSGAIAAADSRAILELQTLHGLVILATGGGVAMDFCGFRTFTHPNDIRPLVSALTGFDVTSTSVPTTGVDSTEVKEAVVGLATAFFLHALHP